MSPSRTVTFSSSQMITANVMVSVIQPPDDHTKYLAEFDHPADRNTEVNHNVPSWQILSMITLSRQTIR
jgi:hypothetical protein